MKALLVTATTALALAGVAPGAAHASGPREVFVEAAFAARLGEGDVGILETVPACFLSDKRASCVFCVGRAVAADKSERLTGVIVHAKGPATTATLQVLTAAAAADGDDPSDDPKGRAAVNRALDRARWAHEVAWVQDYTLRSGKLEGGATQEVALPDGRKATLDATGLRVSDGTRLAIAPAPERPLTYVSVYALPGTPSLIAAVYDARAEDRDAVAESRFVLSTREGAAPATVALPADAACPDGVWCPPHYAALRPLLERFCGDDFGDDAVAEVTALAERGALDAEDLSVL
ncbi:MAG: hypothetical protein EP329_17790, partial [Deltaproteobacteria bacterium]